MQNLCVTNEAQLQPSQISPNTRGTLISGTEDSAANQKFKALGTVSVVRSKFIRGLPAFFSTGQGVM